MIFKKSQKCFNLYSSVNWMQASQLIKQFGTLGYSRAYYKVPLDKDATSNPHLLQVCSQCTGLFSSKRHKSHHIKHGSSKSAHIYAKKFLAGGMVDPKLPWVIYTGQPKVKKSSSNKGGNTTSRRLSVLDQIFFDAITDLMAGGVLGDRLAGRGLVITKVCVQDCLIGMKVFWALSLPSEELKPGKEVKEGVEEQSMQDLLREAAPILRQELANLRVVGCTVPHINFAPDLSIHNSMKVERILLKVREEFQNADDCAEEAAKKEQELLLEQQRRLQVPDNIFAPDFVYRPVYYDETNLPKNSTRKPLSRFTPFAPRGKGLRVGPKNPVVDSTGTDATDESLNNSLEDIIISTDSIESEPESAPAENSPIRLRKLTPQHGIMLQNNVYGINRDRIMEKIASSIGRMKEYVSVTNADLNFPCALTLRLPSGEPETSEQEFDDFESKSSLKNWAYKYSKKSSRNRYEELEIVRKRSTQQAEQLFLEQESTKYEKYEEELKKLVNEEDHWDELD